MMKCMILATGLIGAVLAGGLSPAAAGPAGNMVLDGNKLMLNPQPLPPGSRNALNPQPLPPGAVNGFNPQPDPPGRMAGMSGMSGMSGFQFHTFAGSQH